MRKVAVLALTLGASVARAAPNPVVVSGDPIAPPIAQPGTGLCVASAISQNPANDFPTNTQTYDAALNAFLEMHLNDRVSATMLTVFDLSNNNTSGLKSSYGDFTDSMLPMCQTGGCDFFVNDTTTSFGSRMRGFLNVTQSMAGRPLHFGFYADDAVSLTFFDNKQNAYPVLIRPPQLGAPTWRTTNTVTFNKPGLYPLEILYCEIVEHAALEFSILDGPFADFELPANQMGSVNLKTAGFNLFTAANFFQTEDGQPPFNDPKQCAQCNRQFANLPGNGGCGAGYYCNGAAVCAPCDTALFCGPTCSPCGASTPFCINGNAGAQCGQCRTDADCKMPFKCDATTHMCLPCNVDSDCERGKRCDAHQCVLCDSPMKCAGVSCNCCPGGKKCAALDAGGAPICVECVSDGDCAGRTCDTVNGRCVDKVAECNTPDKCGGQCLRCPNDRPFCLNGQVCVECRSDVDCGAGEFCLSGGCTPCATDRHCGLRCAACAGDTPFCKSDGTAEHALCVRCISDGDCAGGTCDAATHQCSTTCGAPCPNGTFCDGKECVQCYAAAHCPCGGTCDTDVHVCSPACKDSGDCGSGEHCTASDRACVPGRVRPDENPGGGPCCGVAARPGAGGVAFAALVLSAIALLLRRRARRA